MNEHVKQQAVTPTHKNIHVALAAAQESFGPVVKGATNPHFRSKYADLADVVSVALPALNGNGITLFHQIVRVDERDYMRTVLMHGETDTSIQCDVPLIVAKDDMQGFKSATTYAKRIGLESLTGIAPEDDDGNAAAAAPPPKQESKANARELYDTLQKDMRENKTPADLERWWKDDDVKQMRSRLPTDWQKNLTEQCGDYGRELKSQADQSAPEFA